MIDVKSSEEMRRLEWEMDTKLIQDQIVQLPRNDPYRTLLQADLDRRFVERYGTKPSVTGGGAHVNTKTGKTTGNINYSDGPAYFNVVPRKSK